MSIKFVNSRLNKSAFAPYDRNSGNNRKIANVIQGLKLEVKPNSIKKSEDNTQDT